MDSGSKGNPWKSLHFSWLEIHKYCGGFHPRDPTNMLYRTRLERIEDPEVVYIDS